MKKLLESVLRMINAATDESDLTVCKMLAEAFAEKYNPDALKLLNDFIETQRLLINLDKNLEKSKSYLTHEFFISLGKRRSPVSVGGSV